MSRLCVIRDGPLPGAVNMETDARLLAAHRPDSAPVLRLYRWRPPAVSIGYNQRTSDFDHAGLMAKGYDLVRRPTGGRAILHAQELTYAVVGTSPSVLFGRSLHETYQVVNRALLAFLRGLGIEADVSAGESPAAQRGLACFHSAGQHEIRVAGRKLIGSAQRRGGRVFLQHGSILTGPGHADLASCLAGSSARRSSRSELLASTTDLGRILGREIAEVDYVRLCDRLCESFAEAWGLEPDC